VLTDVLIKNLIRADKRPTKRTETPDGRVVGLYFVRQPSGAASWALRYRVGGKPAKLTLGPFPEIDLPVARRKAEEARGMLAGGKDPAAQKKASMAAAKAAARADDDTMFTVAKAFVEKHAKRKAGKLWSAETERLLRVDILPKLGAKRIGEVKRSDIHDLLDNIVERGSPVTANRALAVLRKMFNWAIERDLVIASPVDRVKNPTIELSRDHVLSDDELRAVWLALDRVGWSTGPYGKLLLLTAARRMEVAAMRWTEVDFGAKTWTIPRERSKNGVAHEIPLSEKALEILEALPRIASKQSLVFTNSGRTPIGGFARVKERIDAAIAEANNGAPIERWTLHDLRRTAASGMAGIGIAPHIVEAVLGHRGTIKGVALIYNRYSYSAEKRAAMTAWSRRLHEIVTGEVANVVELASVRG
jgi:integrase